MPTQDHISKPPSLVKPTVLSVRLREIVSLIPESARVIDVGTDHGQVPAYLLENRLTQKVLATDIHDGPADTARKYLRRQGVMKDADVMKTDGLHGVVLNRDDTVVLSGLGGLEMIRILTESMCEHKEEFPVGVHILMQPQRSAEELRIFLQVNGFLLVKEQICIDREKLYVILLARYTGGKQSLFSLAENILGPRILADRPDHYRTYLLHQRNVLRKHMRARPELHDVIAYIENLLKEDKA
jgi:tRNA (adenine22-N1)-methyltransferase